MSRFVRPETDVLKLSGGDTLVVKRRLNTGERRALYEAMSSSANGDGRRVIDLAKSGRATIMAYLLDWAGSGFTDDDGRPIVIREQPPEIVGGALDQLEQDDFTEILRAIEAHENAQAAKRAEEKKTRSGESSSPPT